MLLQLLQVPHSDGGDVDAGRRGRPAAIMYLRNRVPLERGAGIGREHPRACAQLRTSGLVTRSGVVPTTPKRCWSMRE